MLHDCLLDKICWKNLGNLARHFSPHHNTSSDKNASTLSTEEAKRLLTGMAHVLFWRIPICLPQNCRPPRLNQKARRSANNLADADDI